MPPSMPLTRAISQTVAPYHQRWRCPQWLSVLSAIMFSFARLCCCPSHGKLLNNWVLTVSQRKTVCRDASKRWYALVVLCVLRLEVLCHPCGVERALAGFSMSRCYVCGVSGGKSWNDVYPVPGRAWHRGAPVDSCLLAQRRERFVSSNESQHGVRPDSRCLMITQDFRRLQTRLRLWP